MFWDHRNKLIFLAIKAIISRAGDPDLTMVSNELKGSPEVPLSYLTSIIQAGGNTYSSTDSLIAIIEKTATDRKIIQFAEEAIRKVGQGQDGVLPSLVSELLTLNGKNAQKSVRNAKELSRDYLELLDERSQRGGLSGIPFGFSDLDYLTAGAEPGQLIVVAARPSEGKSAFVENVVANMLRGQTKVVFFSLETGWAEIMDRLMGRSTRLGHAAFKHGVSDNAPKAEAAIEVLSKLNDRNIIIDDSPTTTSEQLLAKATHYKMQNLADVIVVDYLQLLKDKTEKGESYSRTVGRISQNLKVVARSLNIPVIVTAQLNRDAAGSGEPELHHLKESGQIEQDADIGILLWRGDPQTEPGITHFKVAKNRHGDIGTFNLRFNGKLTRFEST